MTLRKTKKKSFDNIGNHVAHILNQITLMIDRQIEQHQSYKFCVFHFVFFFFFLLLLLASIFYMEHVKWWSNVLNFGSILFMYWFTNTFINVDGSNFIDIYLSNKYEPFHCTHTHTHIIRYILMRKCDLVAKTTKFQFAWWMRGQFFSFFFAWQYIDMSELKCARILRLSCTLKHKKITYPNGFWFSIF